MQIKHLIQSLILESSVSCLSCSSNDLLGVGFKSGEVTVYRTEYESKTLKNLYSIDSEMVSVYNNNYYSEDILYLHSH